MGRIVFIALVIGLAYAWHKGMLDEYLGQRAAPPEATGAQRKERYDPSKRYAGADTSPAEQCAQARAKVKEFEGWPEKDAALQQARQFIQDRCGNL